MIRWDHTEGEKDFKVILIPFWSLRAVIEKTMPFQVHYERPACRISDKNPGS